MSSLNLYRISLLLFFFNLDSYSRFKRIPKSDNIKTILSKYIYIRKFEKPIRNKQQQLRMIIDSIEFMPQMCVLIAQNIYIFS